MKVCSYCGRENDDALSHCRECGTVLVEPVETEPAVLLPAAPRPAWLLPWIRSWRARSEFTIVIVLCLGWFLLGSLQALSGDEQSAVLEDDVLRAITKYELTAGLLAALFLWARGWSILDFQISLSWLATACAIPLVVVDLYLQAIVSALLDDVVGGGAQLDQLVYSIKVSLHWAITASVVNGAFEELVLVGYVMRRFRVLGFGTALGVSVLLRSMLHFYQGPSGVAGITAMGILFGSYYWFFGRLWTLMLAHMLLDLLAFTQF